MSPPGKSGPSRIAEDYRKRQSTGRAAKRAKRCIRPAPVLVPVSAPPVLLAPIAPAVVPSTAAACRGPLATVPVPPMQFPIANGMAAQHGGPQSAGLPPCHQFATAPHIFIQSSKLRSGKWHAAEEEYADLLIEFFDKGFAVECENGATLRSFLSRKLHCSPMRISKKYAGKGIGKKVFLAKGSSQGTQRTASMDTKAAIAKLKVAEAKFYNSLFPGSNLHLRQMDAMIANSSAFFPGLAPFPALSGHGSIPSAPAHGMPASSVILNLPFQPQQKVLVPVQARRPLGHRQNNAQRAQIPMVSNATPISNSVLVLQDPHVKATTVPQTVPVAPRIHADTGQSSSHAPTTTTTTTSNDSNDNHTAKLHQSYLRALKNMEEATKGANRAGQTHHLQNSTTTANLHRINPPNPPGHVPAAIATTRQSGACQSGCGSPAGEIRSLAGHTSAPTSIVCNKGTDQVYLPGVETMNPTVKPTTVLSAQILHTTATQMNKKPSAQLAPCPGENQSVSESSAASEKANQAARVTSGGAMGVVVIEDQPVSQEPGGAEANTSDAKELPDLLAGFDKASRWSGSPLQVQPTLSYEYSPPFTSRSFDDFHRFLGKDLAPLNGEVGAADTTQIRGGDSLVQKQSQSRVLDRNAAAPLQSSTSVRPTLVTQGRSLGMNTDPYQLLSAAASEHSAFVPHVSMFDTTNEYKFFPDLGGALKPTRFRGGARETLGDHGTTCGGSPVSGGYNAVFQSASDIAPASAVAAFTPNRDASVVSGSERSSSDYCPSRGSVDSLHV